MSQQQLLTSSSAAAGALPTNPNAWDISKAYYDAGADAGDISTTLYTGFSLNTSEGGGPQDLFVSSDGNQLYVIEATADSVLQYTMSQAWVLSTATYASKSFVVDSQDNAPTAVFFKSDGTKMYVLGSANDTV